MIRPSEIVCMVEIAFGAEPMAFSRNTKDDRSVACRLACYLLLRNHLDMTTIEIGRYAGRDHSTIVHGCRRAEERIAQEPAFAAIIDRLTQTIEYRKIAEGRLEHNALDTATKILMDPRRAAMAATVYEIGSMASMLVDLWDAALAAEAVLAALSFTETDIADLEPEGHAAVRTYRDAFLNHMETFRHAEGYFSDD